MRKGFLIEGGLPRARGDAGRRSARNAHPVSPLSTRNPRSRASTPATTPRTSGPPWGEILARAHQKIAEVGGRPSSSAWERVRQVNFGPAPVGGSPSCELALWNLTIIHLLDGRQTWHRDDPASSSDSIGPSDRLRRRRVGCRRSKSLSRAHRSQRRPAERWFTRRFTRLHAARRTTSCAPHSVPARTGAKLRHPIPTDKITRLPHYVTRGRHTPRSPRGRRRWPRAHARATSLVSSARDVGTGSPRPFNRVPSRNPVAAPTRWTDPTVVLTEGWGHERPDTAASGGCHIVASSPLHGGSAHATPLSIANQRSPHPSHVESGESACRVLRARWDRAITPPVRLAPQRILRSTPRRSETAISSVAHCDPFWV